MRKHQTWITAAAFAAAFSFGLSRVSVAAPTDPVDALQVDGPSEIAPGQTYLIQLQGRSHTVPLDGEVSLIDDQQVYASAKLKMTYPPGTQSSPIYGFATLTVPADLKDTGSLRFAGQAAGIQAVTRYAKRELLILAPPVTITEGLKFGGSIDTYTHDFELYEVTRANKAPTRTAFVGKVKETGALVISSSFSAIGEGLHSYSLDLQTGALAVHGDGVPPFEDRVIALPEAGADRRDYLAYLGYLLASVERVRDAANGEFYYGWFFSPPRPELASAAEYLTKVRASLAP